MEAWEHIIWIVVIITCPIWLVWIITKCESKPIIPTECPVCLGDGGGEGWQMAFKCDACNGTGKYTPNERTYREERKDKAQMEINHAANTMNYSDYQKWLDKRINKK